MAGSVADRELRRSTPVRFALATPADEGAIRRLLRENPMEGNVRMTFEREPDYFRGGNVAGAEDETIVAFARGQLVCMGRCSRREGWIDGEVTRMGYLAELRLDGSARGQFSTLRDGYRFFHERQRGEPGTFYFTSIAADNQRARRLLERGVRGMPSYEFLAELATVLVAVPRRPGRPRLRVESATAGDVPEMLRLLNGQAQRHQLAAVWTAERLHALSEHGLPLEGFLLAREDGELVGGGALWDQRSFRQTVIRGYGAALGAARPLLSLLARLRGRPGLPRIGGTLANAFLSPLALAEEWTNGLPAFLAAFFPAARASGIEFLTLALPANDPRIAGLQRQFSTRLYRSRLYRVGWPREARPPWLLTGRPFLPEVALL